jgi:hypothetical protein
VRKTLLNGWLILADKLKQIGPSKSWFKPWYFSNKLLSPNRSEIVQYSHWVLAMGAHGKGLMRLANASIEKGEDTIRFATMQASRVLLKRGPILEKGKTTKA